MSGNLPGSGTESREVANTKYNIAGLHERQGNLEAARELFLESAEIYTAVLGPEHEESLDARRRAETVGEEEEEEEEEWETEEGGEERGSENEEEDSEEGEGQ